MHQTKCYNDGGPVAEISPKGMGIETMTTSRRNNSESAIFVSFHIGRGGRFNSPGTLTFQREEDFQQLIRRCSDFCVIINEDDNGKPLADDDWLLVDTGGNVILQGREEIEAEKGCLEWDTIYDTDYVKTTDNLSEAEENAIWTAYINKDYMSDALKDEICRLKGYKRVSEVKRYPTNLIVFDQDASTHISFDGMVGEYTRDEWREDLAERGFDKLSIEKILDKMVFCATNDKEFFSEDN